MTNLEIAERYLDALAAGVDAEGLIEFYAPDVVQEEFPNRLMPNGAVRDLTALKEARARGKALVAGEEYEVISAVTDGEKVALEVIWRGTIAVEAGSFKAGQRLRARFAIFLEFRDGRISRQRNYDCFEPW